MILQSFEEQLSKQSRVSMWWWTAHNTTQYNTI